MKPIKKVAVIHDLSGVGSVALMNIIPVLSVMGVEVCPIPTMLLSTHTGGFGVPEIRKQTGYIEECAAHYKKIGVSFDTIFVGYLGSEEAIKEAIIFIENNKESNVVIDPIFGDHGSFYSNFDKNYVGVLKELLPYADIIVPNYTEACMLTGAAYTDRFQKDIVEKICKTLNTLGANKIIITSIPGNTQEEAGYAIYEKDSLTCTFYQKIGVTYPGTGDLFAAVLIGKWMKDHLLEQAVAKAHQFVTACILDSSKYDYQKREGVLYQKNLGKLID